MITFTRNGFASKVWHMSNNAAKFCHNSILSESSQNTKCEESIANI